ncbi:methionine--tRNA ligase [Candidatus Hydrogenedentota bacterium]
MSTEKILITSALPYANGSLHIGQIAGAYLPADIYARFNRLKGNDVVYICGADEYGVAMTIKAESEEISPQELVEKYFKEHKHDFGELGFSFDNFSRTSLPVHHETTKEVFLKLHENGYITTKCVLQLQCAQCSRFLPDRYVEGECPHCGDPGARGDQCEACGRWIEATELVHPVCKTCGGTPVPKETTQWFFTLSKFQVQLQEWIGSKDGWKENVRNFCKGWFKEGLEDRAITRDISWGIPVPLEEAEGKVFYVWFDAPIGYISATKEWASKVGKPDKWKEYWCDPECKLVHFIGKDNIVFHSIVWPSFLMGHGDYNLPTDIPANEFLNIEGSKLSTSRNWAVWVPEFLKTFSADSLRYCLAVNAPENRDTDFSWKDFQLKNNKDLADVLGNFVNRTLTFIRKYFDGKVPEPGEFSERDNELLVLLEDAPEKIGKLLSRFSVKQATSELMHLARAGNKYFDDERPWATRKTDMRRCGTSLYVCVEAISTLAVLFSPVIPFSAQKMWEWTGGNGDVSSASWQDSGKRTVKTGLPIEHPEVLFRKIDDAVIAEQEAKLGE